MKLKKNGEVSHQGEGGGVGATKKNSVDLDMLERLAALGLTDKQLGQVFRVTEQTIQNWKKDPEFLLSLKNGKNFADSMVERSLFERAMGYSHDSEEIHIIRGKVTRVKIIKHYPPDVVAQIFWLKNRQSATWRDRREYDEGETNYITNIIGSFNRNGKKSLTENDKNRIGEIRGVLAQGLSA